MGAGGTLTAGIGVGVGAGVKVAVGINVGVAVGGADGGDSGASTISCSGVIWGKAKKLFLSRI
jgi:hypothetical protein